MSKVKYRKFSAVIKSWDAVFSEAAEFASLVGKDRVISISHSEDHNEAIVTVWYWA